MIPRFLEWMSADWTWRINSRDRAYIVEFLHEALIPRLHVDACLPGADVGKLRQQTLIYILMDTEERRLTSKTACTIMWRAYCWVSSTHIILGWVFLYLWQRGVSNHKMRGSFSCACEPGISTIKEGVHCGSSWEYIHTVIFECLHERASQGYGGSLPAVLLHCGGFPWNPSSPYRAQRH